MLLLPKSQPCLKPWREYHHLQNLQNTLTKIPQYVSTTKKYISLASNLNMFVTFHDSIERVSPIVEPPCRVSTGKLVAKESASICRHSDSPYTDPLYLKTYATGKSTFRTSCLLGIDLVMTKRYCKN